MSSGTPQLVAPVRRQRPPRDGAPAASATVTSGALAPDATVVPSSPIVASSAPGVTKQLSEAQISLQVKNLLDANRTSLLPSNISDINETNDERHAVTAEEVARQNAEWRNVTLGKVKTAHGLLFLCLNIGSDPPDVARIEPCAKLECWIDPLVAQAKMTASTGDIIADSLEAQYRFLQKDAMYRKCLDLSVDDAKQNLFQMRKKARDGRVLVHYNGHGMPKATHHGEIWFFDQQHTHYIPLNFSEISAHVESPTLYVLDCNSAGSILNYWRATNFTAGRPRDYLICACSDGETLPMNPVLPADLLTSCLTTPVRMALEWYIYYSHRQRLLPNVTAEMIRSLPGDLTARKTPLGELQWIFTAITDTIAWCSTPNEMFYAIFRQDVLTKSLFRNFLLADKLLREVGCVPVSCPEIAGNTHSHHMWDVWDVAVESILSQLPEMLRADLTPVPGFEHTPSTFFVDQLTAFEVWISVGDTSKKPEQLPSVLLCLNSHAYRVRALLALCRYLNTGPHAVHNTLFCGAMSYLVKLFSSPEMMLLLTVVWLQVLCVDPEVACAELQRAQAEKSFLRLLTLCPQETPVIVENPQSLHNAPHLSSSMPDDAAATMQMQATAVTASSPNARAPQGTLGGGGAVGIGGNSSPLRGGSTGSNPGALPPGHPPPAPAPAAEPPIQYHTMPNLTIDRCQAIACYILSQMITRGGEKAALACWNANLLMTVVPLLSAPSVETRSWAALLLSRAVQSLRLAKSFLANEYSLRHEFLHPLLQDRSPVVRASCCTLLANLIGFRPDLVTDEEARDRRLHVDRSIFTKLCFLVYDPSPAVRAELAYAAARVLYHYGHVALESKSAITMDFIVSHRGAKFDLLQTAMGKTVQSSLTSSRPTDNAQFADNITFTLTFAARDEPLPTSEWGPTTEHVRDVIAELVHDAAVMLAHLFSTPDRVMVELVAECVRQVRESDQQPFSNRVEVEAGTTMQGITTQRVEVVTEVDRARQLRNHDLARQVVLDLAGKTLQPYDARVHEAQKPKAGEDKDGLPAPRPHHVGLQLFSSPHEHLVCGQFRALEPQVVVASRSNVIDVVDYVFTLDRPCTTRYSFAHATDALVSGLHVVNDLAEHPLLLTVDRRATFTLYRGAFNGDASICLSFTVSVTNGSFSEMVTAYRPRDAAIFYGNHGANISILNLSEERVMQTIPIPGDTALNCLVVDTSVAGKTVFGGFADGTIKFFDDRTNTGQVGLVSVIEDQSIPSTSRSSGETIVGIGLATQPNILYTSTTTALKFYDIRQPKTCLFRKDIASATTKPATSLLSPANITTSFGQGLGSIGGSGGGGASSRQSVSAFAVCPNFPLMSSLTTDGTVDFYTHRGESLLSTRAYRAKDATRGTCIMHPAKTMGLFGSEIVALI